MNEESKLIELFKKIPRNCCTHTEVICLSLRPNPTEIEAEVATINKDDAATIIDYTTEYMEESMGWPDPDNQTNFNNQLA